MDITIVVPVYNEVESLPELASWIKRVMDANKYSYEVIMIDDGSRDGSWGIIEELASQNTSIRGIKFRRNYGKAAALNSGFSEAKGDVVVTMDADLQDSPDEVPDLYKMVMKKDYDLVSGWKKKRHDPFSKTFPSKIYNRLVRMFTGIKLHDFNCGLKAYRNAVVKSIEVQGDMHRYVPVIAKAAGFKKIGEKVVEHRARKFGESKYGFGRAKGMLDLLTISFIAKFGKKPMQFFGTIGVMMFLIGILSSLWLGGTKLYYLYKGIPAKLVTDSPYFYIALATIIIGTQFFLAGYLAELVSRSSHDRNRYDIEKKI